MPRFTKEGHRNRCNEHLASVLQYFSEEPARWDRIYPLLLLDGDDAQEERISFRLLDYLVTTYSKTHVCQYQVQDSDGQTRLVNIHQSAQTLLKGVHKRSLDPFCRRNKCLDNDGLFEFGHGEKRARTSAAQLLFFRWALRYGVIDYAEQHAAEIRADMAESARQQRKRARQEIPSPLPEEIVFEFAEEEEERPSRRRRRFRLKPPVQIVVNSGALVESVSFKPVSAL